MGSLENRYVSVRKRLDELGYREAFGFESLALVEHLCLDLLKTTQNLQKYFQESSFHKKISKELEEGVEPFKNENLRLVKENSQLRLAIQRNQEKLDEKLQGSKSRLRDLETENTELKLLVGQFVERVKLQDIESLAKTRKMAQLQERNLQASVIIRDGEKKCLLVQRQRMEIDDPAPKLCPHCTRIRNYARFGRKHDRDPTPIDYMKVADSRIEALTLQNRSLKTTQQDLMDLIKSMKSGIDMRECELDKLKFDMKLGVCISRDGVDKILASSGDHDVESYAGKDCPLALKSAQLQLQVLQKRNLNLERKLQQNFIQGHDDFMLHRSRSAAERHLITSAFDDNGECMFLPNENITVDEKLRLLESQLSHCCREKAKLKALLEDYERKHQARRTTPDRDVHPKTTETVLSTNKFQHPQKLQQTSQKKSETLLKNQTQATRDLKKTLGIHKTIPITKPSNKQSVGHFSRAKLTAAPFQNGKQKSKVDSSKKIELSKKIRRQNFDDVEEEVEYEDVEKDEDRNQVGESKKKFRGPPTKQGSPKQGRWTVVRGKYLEGKILNKSQQQSSQPQNTQQLNSDMDDNEDEDYDKNDDDDDSLKEIDSPHFVLRGEYDEGSKDITDFNSKKNSSKTKLSKQSSRSHIHGKSTSTSKIQSTLQRPSESKSMKNSQPNYDVDDEDYEDADNDVSVQGGPHVVLRGDYDHGSQQITDSKKKSTSKTKLSKQSSRSHIHGKSTETSKIQSTLQERSSESKPKKNSQPNYDVDVSDNDYDEDADNDVQVQQIGGPRFSLRGEYAHETQQITDDQKKSTGRTKSNVQSSQSHVNRKSTEKSNIQSILQRRPSESKPTKNSETNYDVDDEDVDNDESVQQIGGPHFVLRGEYDKEPQPVTNSKKHPGGTKSSSKQGSRSQVHGKSTEESKIMHKSQKQPSKIQPVKNFQIDSDIEDADYEKGDLDDDDDSIMEIIPAPKVVRGGNNINGQQKKADVKTNEDTVDYGPPPGRTHRQPSRGSREKESFTKMERTKILRPIYNVEEVGNEEEGNEDTRSQVGSRQKVLRESSKHSSGLASHGGSTESKIQKKQQPSKNEPEKIQQLNSDGDTEEYEDSDQDEILQEIVDRPSTLRDGDKKNSDHHRVKDSRKAARAGEAGRQRVMDSRKTTNTNEEDADYGPPPPMVRTRPQPSTSKGSREKESGIKTEPRKAFPPNYDAEGMEYEAAEKAGTRSQVDSRQKLMPREPSKQIDRPLTRGKSMEGKIQNKLQKQPSESKPMKTLQSNQEYEDVSHDAALREIGKHPFPLHEEDEDEAGYERVTKAARTGEFDRERGVDPRKAARAEEADRQRAMDPRKGARANEEDADYGPPARTQPPISRGLQEKESPPKMSSFKVPTLPHKSQDPYQSSLSKTSLHHPGGYPIETEFPDTTPSKYAAPWSTGGYGRAPEGSRNNDEFVDHGQPYSRTGRISPTGQPSTTTEYSRTVGYNPYSSALPNVDTAADSRELQQRIRSLERVIDNMKMKASLVDASKSDLENEVLKLRRALAECQEHGQQLKSEVQKAKIMLEQTEGLLKDTQRKAAANYIPTQKENQELSQQVRQLMAKEMVLEREVSTLAATVKALDRDKDEMRVELDRKDEKLARMQAENAKHFDELSKLQLQLKNAELQSSHTGEAFRDQERELALLRRERDDMKRELEKRIRERDSAQRDLNVLSQSSSKRDLEKRYMTEELEKRSKESEDLKKQLQKYIDEVRRIEELLLKKDEEMEILMDNYRTLSQEKGALESQRSILERQTSTAREALDSNSALTNKIASQTDLIHSYEEEISNLSGQVATLENQLMTLRDAEKLLKGDVKAARDFSQKLETKLDSMRLDVANAESAKNKCEAENAELRSNMELMTSQLTSDGENQKKLEDVLTKMREKEYQAEQTNVGITAERDVLAARLSTLNARIEQLNGEVERYRLRSAELQGELDKLKRQYQNEKSEREAALAELKRIQAQLSTTSASLLMSSALGPSSRTPSPAHYTTGQQGGGILLPPDLSPVPVSQSLHDTRIPSPVPDHQ